MRSQEPPGKRLRTGSYSLSAGPSSPRASSEHQISEHGAAGMAQEGAGDDRSGPEGAVDPAGLDDHMDSVIPRADAAFENLWATLLRELGPERSIIALRYIQGRVADSVAALQQQQQQQGEAQRALMLHLRHHCQSTGCGERACLLCQYNPSRLCLSNFKCQYLEKDPLKAKCKSPLLVELVDNTNNMVSGGLKNGERLMVHMLNGGRFNELSNNGTVLLPHNQLRQCILGPGTVPPLKRGNQLGHSFELVLNEGQAQLSDLAANKSSQVLLGNKDAEFRLLVWVVDARGNPVRDIAYAVSEGFRVATRRVRHDQKSDIPTVADHVSKLEHIGKKTVIKLLGLRKAARLEGVQIDIPDDLAAITTVGQFQALLQHLTQHPVLQTQIRKLLRLGPDDKWEELVEHAESAVVPDSRPRVWWPAPGAGVGLVLSCVGGAISWNDSWAIEEVLDQRGWGTGRFVAVTASPNLLNMAKDAWHTKDEHGNIHPGWSFYELAAEQDDPRGMAPVMPRHPGWGIHFPGVQQQAPLVPPVTAQQFWQEPLAAMDEDADLLALLCDEQPADVGLQLLQPGVALAAEDMDADVPLEAFLAGLA